MLSQVLRTVQDAQSSKPAIQRIADKISTIFVPVVVSYALAAFLLWLLLGFFNLYPTSWRGGESVLEYSFQFFLATVVSACPCALGLATPTAIMVGTGVGASNGILIKSGTILETCGNVTAVVLDKTGTITKGEQTVVHCVAQDLRSSHPIPEAMRVLLSIAKTSNHPISKSIAAYASATLQQQQDCRTTTTTENPLVLFPVGVCVTVPGHGVRATMTVPSTVQNGSSSTTKTSATATVLLGSLRFVQGEGVTVGLQTLSAINAHQTAGMTTVLCAMNDELLFVLSLCDPPKREAQAVVDTLVTRKHIRVFMVTGDSVGVAEAVGHQVGIPSERIHAQVLPEGKANFVRDLQALGETVMFVGDGINDSPALAAADVGVALGAGTDIAIEAADTVLIHSNLVDLLTLMTLSQRTVRRIYGNFVWACAYNILMLPVAAGLFVPIFGYQLSPMIAGAAMVCSSLSVLGSSLLLRCFTPLELSDLPRTRSSSSVKQQQQPRVISEAQSLVSGINRDD
jgi:Cu+-exporting ATPase